MGRSSKPYCGQCVIRLLVKLHACNILYPWLILFIEPIASKHLMEFRVKLEAQEMISRKKAELEKAKEELFKIRRERQRRSESTLAVLKRVS